VDKRLLRLYERELRHLRESASEFAEEFPKIAGRLALSEFDCADPYVERLLEGFAFMAARVQLKLDAQFPRFTNHLLDSVYPHYLAPTPSMLVARCEPDYADGGLAKGVRVPRNTAMRSVAGKGERTSCEYRTAHDVTLWPIKLVEASYVTQELGSLMLPQKIKSRTPRAGLRMKFEATAGLTFDKIGIDNLDIFLTAADQTDSRLYEQLFGHTIGACVRPATRPPSWDHVLEPSAIRQIGFSDSEALLPVGPRSFQGYRLLHEYFAFPRRFMFFRVAGLAEALRKSKESSLEIVVLFDELDVELDGAVSEENFELHCTPAINLFPKRTDRIHVQPFQWEFHVVADRTRPLDFEIFGINQVEGYGASADDKTIFRPFYAASDYDDNARAFFSVERRPRVLSSKERAKGRIASYAGSEVFISLVDATSAPFTEQLAQLGVDAMCTNRHLPLRMPVGLGRTDMTADATSAIQEIRVVAGPTAPTPSFAEIETAWRVINHLTLNYLTLVDTATSPDAQAGSDGAASLRELMKLYGVAADAVHRKQVQGVRSVSARPITRRVPSPGPIAFARGLEISLLLDDPYFEGVRPFLFGAVMEHFFSKYVSINSFTETVIRSTERGEIKRWPPRMGLRATL